MVYSHSETATRPPPTSIEESQCQARRTRVSRSRTCTRTCARRVPSKEKAARISNAAARDGKSKVAERGGESPSYHDWTVSELKKRAKELGLTNYSAKTKSELITALRNH